MDTSDTFGLPSAFEEFEEEERAPAKRDFNYPLVGTIFVVASAISGVVGHNIYQTQQANGAQRAAFSQRFEDATIAPIQTSTCIDKLTQLKHDMDQSGVSGLDALNERIENQLNLLGDWTRLQASVAKLQSASNAAITSLNRTQNELNSTRDQLTQQSQRLQETAQALALRERMLELSRQAMIDATMVFSQIPAAELADLPNEQGVLQLPSYVGLRTSQVATRVPENDANDLRNHYAGLLDSEVVELTRRSRDKQALEQAQSEQRALATQLEQWRTQYGDLTRLSEAEKRRLLTEYFAQRGYFRVALSTRTAQTVERHMAGECSVDEGPWGDGCSNYGHIEDDYQLSLRSDDASEVARTRRFISISTRNERGRRVTLRVPFVSRDVLEAMQQGISVFYPADPSKLRGVGRYGVLLSEALRTNPSAYLQAERQWRDALQAAQAANPQQGH